MQLIKDSKTQLGGRAPASTLQRAAGASASQSQAPQLVLRGAKCQDLTEVSIDWLRMSGPRVCYYEALHLLEKRFGKAEEGKGRFFLNSGHHWAEGGMFYDMDKPDNAKHCLVELPGKLIGELEHSEVRQIMHDLHTLGFKSTRIDIAVDYYDRPDLIKTITDSCDRGELCRAKTYQNITEHSGGALVGHGVNIGKRGKKGSGRYLRVYDKGLETKTLDPGNWIRWESELSDDCAQQFSIQYTSNPESISCCLSHALWVVEFREQTGARLSRRPLAGWFKEITEETTPERVRAVRAKSTLHSYARWVKTCVAPKFATIANITGNTLGGVIDHISGPVEPRTDHLQCPKVRSVAKSLGAKQIKLRTDQC